MRPDLLESSTLPRDFYDRDTTIVARELLGKWLVHRQGSLDRIGRIVEAEAYLGPHDQAAHSARGRTARTEVMFGPPGHAYVYIIYGMHFCLNAVTGPRDHASAVLIRAVEPIANITEKTSGPGLLCRAMSIDKSLNGADLTQRRIFITNPPDNERISIVKRPRIGVDYAGAWARRLLRFYIRNNAHVSRK